MPKNKVLTLLQDIINNADEQYVDFRGKMQKVSELPDAAVVRYVKRRMQELIPVTEKEAEPATAAK